ncbi:MAG TPA: hypothetical protein VL738_08365 [Dactylosporangium sp.]|jgi:hypothetical protein|nr:hypothetical protein [Dactylosporangium sp.]
MPFSVRLARWVLLAAGAATLAGGLAGLVARGSVAAAYVLEYGDAGLQRSRIALAAGVILGTAAAGCCLYAAARLRAAARGPAWLVCALLVSGLSPVFFGGGTIIAPRVPGQGVTSADLATDLHALAPRWYPPTVAALACFAACAALAAALLLAWPAPADPHSSGS